MKAVYLSASIPYTDEMRKEFHGCRIENAQAFQGVARGIETAVIYGDFPEIKKALEAVEDPKIDIETRPEPKTNDAPKTGDTNAKNDIKKNDDAKDSKRGKGAEHVEAGVAAGVSPDGKAPKVSNG